MLKWLEMYGSALDRRNHMWLVWAVTLLAQPSSSEVATAQEPDSVLLAVASAAVRGASVGEQVWPGFVLPREFIVCRRGGQTVLVHSGQPPAELGRAIAVQIESDDHVIAYFFNSPLPRMSESCFDLEYRVGDKRLVAFRLIDSAYSIKGSVAATVVGLYHEMFHAYQRTSFAVTSRLGDLAALAAGPRPPRAIVESEEFNRRASQERHLLAAALDLSDSDTLRSVLREYMTLRSQRLELLPESHRHVEAHEERKEATAQIVGYDAGLIAAGRDSSSVRAIIRSDLVHAPPFDAPGFQLGAYRQWHVYATGSAIALLLRQLGVDWKSDVQNGATFADVLERALRASGSSTNELGQRRDT